MTLRAKLVLLLLGFTGFMAVSIASAAWAIGLYLDASFAQFSQGSGLLRDIDALRAAVRTIHDPPASGQSPSASPLVDRINHLRVPLGHLDGEGAAESTGALLDRLAGQCQRLLAGQDDSGAKVAAEESPERLQAQADRILRTLESRITRHIQRVSEQASAVQMRVLILLAANALFAVLLAWGGAVMVRRWLTRPVRALTEGSELLALGKLDTRVPVLSRDELGRLAERFNEMAQRLELSQRLLVERERMAAVGEFSSAVAHGIRNPLSGIMSSAELLLGAMEADAPARSYVRDILVDGERLSQRVQRLLEFARTRTLREELLAVEDLVSQAVSEVGSTAQRRGMSVRTSFPPTGLPLIRGDRELLINAFIEVLSNALEQPNAPPEVEVTAQSQSGCLRVLFRDHGPGFSDEQRAKAFELFYTTKPGGTGVGLTSVLRAVQLHKGAVNLLNHTDGGGVVEVVLMPAAEQG